MLSDPEIIEILKQMLLEKVKVLLVRLLRTQPQKRVLLVLHPSQIRQAIDLLAFRVNV